MSYFKLTIKKGKRKKRAHKKWLKKNPRITAWLREAEQAVARELDEEKFDDKVSDMLMNVFLYGEGSITMPDGSTKTMRRETVRSILKGENIG